MSDAVSTFSSAVRAEIGLPEARRLLLLAAATAVGASGLAAGGTASALLAAKLAGSDRSAGLGPGVVVVGSAVAAVLLSRLSRRVGRGRSLAVGYLGGSVGAAVVVVSASTGSFGGLLAGCALCGVANAAVFLSRYAAAEQTRGVGVGRALGVVFLATAVGAAASPALLRPSAVVAETIGLPRLSGMFVIAGVVFALAGALVARAAPGEIELRRRPRVRAAPLGLEVVGVPDARLAVAALGVSNLVMVGVMAIAPVRMTEHGMGLGLVGLLISGHVAAMFLPSPVSGWIGDRFGPAATISLGLLLFVAAAGYGAIAPADSAAGIMPALAVLGVGWNFGVVGGSALLISVVPDGDRLDAEAIGEVVMAVAAAVAAPIAGLVVALEGLGAVWAAAAAVALVALAGLCGARFGTEVGR
jgi:MFS family permease